MSRCSAARCRPCPKGMAPVFWACGVTPQSAARRRAPAALHRARAGAQLHHRSAGREADDAVRRMEPPSVDATCACDPIRLSADVGGTFTDVAAFDEATGAARARQDAVDAAAAGRRHRERRRQGRTRASRGASCSCTARRSRSTPSWSAPARACALLTTAGLPRHLRDRAHQPAGVLQPVLPQARAADRARRCASRSASASTAQGKVLIPLDEEQVARRRGQRRWRKASRRSRSCSCTPIATRRTSSA